MRFSIPRALVVTTAALIACGGDGTTAVDNTPATITLAPATALTIPSGTTSNIAATILNRGGKPVSGVVVSWSSADPTIATVSGGTVTGAKVGATTITATAGTATTGTATASLSVTVTPGVATQLAMRTQPVGASAGAPLATQPTVEVRDAAGNVVTSSTANVGASIESGGGTLVGPASVAAVGGVATFSGLSVSGPAGVRALAFASTGLAPVTSAHFSITPPAAPLLVLDTNVVNFVAPRGTSPPSARIAITNGGLADLTGMTVAVQFDAGQPTGWLAATLSSTTAPATLTLTAASTTLVEGSYHAVVRVSGPAATNSPVSISVNLTINPNYTVTYGTSSEKVRILDIGSSYAPAVSVTDAAGPVTGIALTFTSRASTVATVAADGRITARGAGDTWVAVTTPISSDSVYVVVPRADGGPLLRTNMTTWLARVGDTLSGVVFLDTRNTPVGAANVAVAINLTAGSLGFVFSAGAGPPPPVVNQASNGIFRISVGAANGMTGSIALLNIKLIGRSTNTTGFLDLYGLDLSGVDGGNLTAATTATRVPFVFR